MKCMKDPELEGILGEETIADRDTNFKEQIT